MPQYNSQRQCMARILPISEMCCSMYCLCGNVYCHRVSTQLLLNVSYHIKISLLEAVIERDTAPVQNTVSTIQSSSSSCRLNSVGPITISSRICEYYTQVHHNYLRKQKQGEVSVCAISTHYSYIIALQYISIFRHKNIEIFHNNRKTKR
jgi:hypothetical protein